MNDLLLNYSKEIFGDGIGTYALTLEELIDSHRALRDLRLQSIEYQRSILKDGFEQGYKQGLQQITKEFVKLVDLKKMTLQEISELVMEYEN